MLTGLSSLYIKLTKQLAFVLSLTSCVLAIYHHIRPAMEPSGEIQKVASMRLGSGGSVWWSGGNDIFSRSSRGGADDDMDEEEALRWATLEKLPTRDRVRRAIIFPLPAGRDTAGTGQAGLVDVDVLSLGPGERRALLELIVRVADEDHDSTSAFL